MSAGMVATSDKATGASNAPAGRFIRLAVVPRECKWARARLRGWMDYRAGLGFRATYDGWDRKRQYAYERGRQQAALTAAARPGVRLPPWRMDELVDDVIRRHLGDWTVADRILEETRTARRVREKA